MLTKVRTSKTGWVHVKESAYKSKWGHASEGERVQVKESANKRRWVNTSEGECVQVKMSE